MKKIIFTLTLPLFLLAADGKKIFTENGCYGCHGLNAQGGSGFPKLAGKSKEYLISKLKGYKSGKIHSNRANMMYSFAKKLSNKEIEEVAKYLSKLKNIKNKDSYYDEEYDQIEPN